MADISMAFVRRVDAAAVALKDAVNKYGEGAGLYEDERDLAIAACARLFDALRHSANVASAQATRRYQASLSSPTRKDVGHD
jgi:hypothetical protein